MKENCLLTEEDSFVLEKNDLENAIRGTSLLLDRLLDKNNIDNYKYIIDSIRKKTKRASVTGEEEEIEQEKKLLKKEEKKN